jgi:hypothetical protein
MIKYLLLFTLVYCLSNDCVKKCEHGKCIGDICKCNYCYTQTYCNYRQSKTWIAFMWEFIIPIGAGHFYSGNIFLGLLKLITMIGTLCYPYVYTVYSVKNAVQEDDQYVMITDVGMNVLTIKTRIIKSKALLLAIYIIDLCLIIWFYNDGNGIELC